jgi:hypothetical protein
MSGILRCIVVENDKPIWCYNLFTEVAFVLLNLKWANSIYNVSMGLYTQEF